jgi:hypothetical protein
MFRPALGPTQPPVQWVRRVSSPGVKRRQGVTLTTHPYLVPRSWISRSYTSSPPTTHGAQWFHHPRRSSGCHFPRHKMFCVGAMFIFYISDELFNPHNLKAAAAGILLNCSAPSVTWSVWYALLKQTRLVLIQNNMASDWLPVAFENWSLYQLLQENVIWKRITVDINHNFPSTFRCWPSALWRRVDL